jgi:hypothetical protein
MSENRVILSENLTFEEGIALAQLVNQPGWKILVRLIAERCRRATEAVIKLDPSMERYEQTLVGLQTTSRAMNKFAADVLDSVKLHQRKAVQEAQRKEKPAEEKPKTMPRFRMPMPESPDTPGTQEN